MSRICLLALCGLPAAGKTFFCHWLLQLQQEFFNIIHMQFDDYLPYATQTVQDDCSYKQLRQQILLEIEQKIQQQQQRNDPQKQLIICDDNNYYRSMRYDLNQICRKQQIAFAQIYFDCKLDTAIDRNLQRPKHSSIPSVLLLRMSERLQAPNSQKFQFERNTLLLNVNVNATFDKEIILHFLQASFDNIVTAVTKTEMMQQPLPAAAALDLLFRQKITKLVDQQTNATNKNARAKILNEKRKQLLQQFKKQQDHACDNVQYDFWLQQLN